MGSGGLSGLAGLSCRPEGGLGVGDAFEPDATGLGVEVPGRAPTGTTSGCPAAITPCGACRQLLWEYLGDVPVLIADATGAEVARFTLGELLPHAFGAGHLDGPKK